MAVPGLSLAGDVVLAGTSGIDAPAAVFNSIFRVFLGLGTLVGVVVIGYTLYNAYKYRYREDEDPVPEDKRPEMGELPKSGGKGKKLFLSFGLSAIIVLSLVLWTYGALLDVESQPAEATEDGMETLDIEVEGFQFGWAFTYPNGHVQTTSGAEPDPLRVPANRMVTLNVTSRDVFHNFGIPEFRVKSDAIPGQTTNAWFVAEEPGEYQANCYEICGRGHSNMKADVIVMSQEEYDEWYASTNGTKANETTAAGEDGGHSGALTAGANP
jgi:cytochrome c oxidase subunit 2